MRGDADDRRGGCEVILRLTSSLGLPSVTRQQAPQDQVTQVLHCGKDKASSGKACAQATEGKLREMRGITAPAPTQSAQSKGGAGGSWREPATGWDFCIQLSSRISEQVEGEIHTV